MFARHRERPANGAPPRRVGMTSLVLVRTSHTARPPRPECCPTTSAEVRVFRYPARLQVGPCGIHPYPSRNGGRPRLRGRLDVRHSVWGRVPPSGTEAGPARRARWRYDHVGLYALTLAAARLFSCSRDSRKNLIASPSAHGSLTRIDRQWGLQTSGDSRRCRLIDAVEYRTVLRNDSRDQGDGRCR